MARSIMVVTGSRADYGLLYWVMKAIQEDPALELQVAITGMHLSSEFGMTAAAVAADGFPIAARVDALQSGDSAAAVAKSIGMGVIGFGELFERLRPDFVLLLGDRFEILAAAQAALVACIPIAHVAGGDVTEGAFDDAIRHSITKMAQLHFVTNAAAEKRVKQLGEDPRFVFNVGSPGLDALRRAKLLGRAELESLLGLAFRQRNLLVTFHPATLEAEAPEQQLAELLRALDSLGEGFGIVFTKANADPRGRALNRMLEAHAAVRPNCRLFDALGQQVYLSLMQQVDAVVGNSSSALYEAPSLRKPAVNIGSRQRGRLRAASVLDCPPEAQAIERAIRSAMSLDCSKVVNPYGDGNSAARIVAALKGVADPRSLVRKRFVDA
jgi:UDP-N-acetylglucosamine 2-epimerase (non-hydrolysing)/GDP/UDP-N,N'-diacetylbacillosamine 2-epimerase (hydrolysing)